MKNIMDDSKMLPNNTKYRQAISSLLYIATVPRPNIAVAVEKLSRCVESPTEDE